MCQLELTTGIAEKSKGKWNFLNGIARLKRKLARLHTHGIMDSVFVVKIHLLLTTHLYKS